MRWVSRPIFQNQLTSAAEPEDYTGKVAAGGYHTVWVNPDGTVSAVGSNSCGQCDVADWTVRSGCAGEKVRHLQVKLARLGYLKESEIDGVCGTATVEAITAFQTAYGLKVTGIANIATQLKLNTEYHESVYNDPLTWRVEPDKEKLTLDGFDDLFASDPWAEEEKQPEATEPPEEEPSVSEETAEKQDSLEGETDPMTEAVPEWVTAEEVPEWAEETVELEED